MSKAVLISVQPKWCGKIFSGFKNLEFRKRKPYFPPPFKCYVYCTSGKDTLTDIIRDGQELYGEVYHGKTVFINYDRDTPYELWHKKKTVIGEMTIDRIEAATWDAEQQKAFYGGKQEQGLLSGGLLVKDFLKYQGDGTVYGWHIADYKLYDKPKEVSDFRLAGCTDRVKRPPQSFCYVNELEG